MASLMKFCICLILCSLFINGVFETFYKVHPNKCEMTYMFQNPQYIKIEIPQVNVSVHKYGLYAYGEGKYAEELKRGQFSGVPILFIPGNQGSYKQVRSLASVAYRKALDEKHSFHFNFFSLDFNEELSAFYGPVLERQTHFVSLSIRRIFELYKNARKKPVSIILVGHSLGGLVARATLMLPEVPASQVPLIITQAAPHRRPVIVLDPLVASFYDNVNEHWESERYQDFVNTIFVTIGGGRNDVQVSNLFTAADYADVDATTLSAPSSWLTTDHLAIVWCRQLVLATTRALFDSIDPVSFSVSTDRSLVVNAFKYQLQERSASKHSFPLSYSSKITNLDKNGVWSEVSKYKFQYEYLKPTKHSFLMIPISSDSSNHNLLTIIGRELDWKNWVFVCKTDGFQSNVPVCSSGLNLSPYGRIIPGNKKEININTKDLNKLNYTHIAVWIHPCDDKVQVAYDYSDELAHSKRISAPTFMSSFSATVIAEKTPVNALTYNVTIDGLTDFWQSYILTIVPDDSCTSNKASIPHVSMSTSWKHRWEYLMSSSNAYEFELEVDVPYNKNSDYEPTVNIHIILYQNCAYKISLQKRFLGIFKRISFIYGLQFPAFMACQFLLVLSMQLKSLSMNKSCSSVFSAILALTPIAVVPFTNILSPQFSRLMDIDCDPQILVKNNLELGLLPIILFLTSLPISMLLASVFWILVIGFGNATHSFAVKLLKRSIRTGDILTEIVIAGFWKVPAVAAVALISLAFGTCGVLALFIGVVLYFIKVFKMYEDYLESFLISLIPGTREAHENRQSINLSSIHLHFSFMILTFFVSILNLPTFITWINFIQNGVQLPDDPSLVPSVLCLLSHGVLLQIKVINPQRKFYKALSYLLHSCAVLVLLFGTIHLYRISYILSVLLLVIALHQLCAPCSPSQGNIADEDMSDLPHMEVLNGEKADECLSPASNEGSISLSSSESSTEDR